jgi:hypothetical protein
VPYFSFPYSVVMGPLSHIRGRTMTGLRPIAADFHSTFAAELARQRGAAQ